MRRSWLPLLNSVRSQVAEIIGADVEECVIVPNATHGINTIVNNIDWADGDKIVICEWFPKSIPGNLLREGMLVANAVSSEADPSTRRLHDVRRGCTDR
jgi:kynureninase